MDYLSLRLYLAPLSVLVGQDNVFGVLIQGLGGLTGGPTPRLYLTITENVENPYL